jgi:hypothetical protein
MADVPACGFCDADVALRETIHYAAVGFDMGERVYLMEIRHDLGCLTVLACYEKG